MLRAIYAGEDGEQARRESENWFGEVQASGIKEMIEASRTLIHWKEPILNFWQHRICNAVTEGKINKIKALRRRAFNYNNFQNLRLKILEQEEMTPSSPHQRV
ncbi:transposase [Candidatus Hakubella thermalkaliphila]|uniref:transposase n=1 Tax=Candidatus Hakubella thermalkaliphila TaxID=2754717 RepID=UPI001593A2DA|nr:transposase [Candidatus Hakubella thermalkaliphila]